MKYCLEWDYQDNELSWTTKIESADSTELKDFIIYGMPNLIQELFERFWAVLKERAFKDNLSEDKIIWVMSLMSVICQNTLSDRLTESLNNFLWEETEETIEETNVNRWDVLLWNNQDNKC